MMYPYIKKLCMKFLFSMVWKLLGLGVSALLFMASTDPDGVAANLTKWWVSILGLQIPNWMSDRSLQVAIQITAIVGTLIFSVWLLRGVRNYLLYSTKAAPQSDRIPLERKDEFHRAIQTLANDNSILRQAALAELLDLARSSQELHRRIIPIIVHRIRDLSPVVPELGRSVEVRALNRREKAVSTNQVIGRDIHELAQVQIDIKASKHDPEVQKLVDWLCARRSDYDDLEAPIDLSETDLSGIIFTGDLRGAIFAGSNLRRAIFDYAQLDRADFSGSILNDASFRGAKLRNAKFFGALAHRVFLEEADLSAANFTFANLYDACVQKANARGADFSGAILWRLWGGLADFDRAQFANADLRGADLHASKNLAREQIEPEDALRTFGPTIDKTTMLPWLPWPPKYD
jgi:hypothetical protein